MAAKRACFYEATQPAFPAAAMRALNVMTAAVRAQIQHRAVIISQFGNDHDQRNNRALTAADDADAKNGNAPRIIGVRRDGAIVRQLPKDSDRTER